MDTGGGNAGSSDASKTSPNSTSETSQHSGCGCASGTTITVRVTPTTGGQFDLQVAKTESVENLKKLISKKLKVPKERICLLHRDRQLRDGTLQENQLMDGSRLTLLPSVETGLLAQRPEQSVMQALESLNDSQVNDFLSGKAPLNLTMRLGDHMMLIQLQLSTVTPSSSRRSNSNTSTTNYTNTTTSTTNTTNCSSTSSSPSSSSSSSSLHSHPSILPATTSTPATSSTTTTSIDSRSSSSSNNNSDSTAQICHSTSSAMQTCSKSNTSSPVSTSAASPSPLLVSSSRSSLISSSSSSHLSVLSSGKNASHSTSNDNHHHHHHHHQSQQKLSHQNSSTESSKLSTSSSSTTGFKFPSPASLPSRPFSSLYTKSSSTNSDTSELSQSSSSSESQHQFVQSPLKSLENATNNLSLYTGSSSTNLKLPVSQTASDSTATTVSNQVPLASTSSHSCTSASSVSTSMPSSSSTTSSASCKCEPTTAAKPTLDTRALAEASRNLTQTLKQLSSEVLTSRSDPAEDSTRARRQGAIIESMHHHGKGVYSGTFSGTLNPALQDRFGRPKRDISTIIHILNDLLCATPQYRRHARQGHTITVEASSGSPSKSSSAGTSTSVSADSRTGHGIDFMEESVTLSRENQATRGKMEQLRLIMEERRARRRARREARSAPYTVTQWSAKSESLSTQQNPAGGSGSAGSLGTHGDEPMDTSPTGEQHVCELNPPEPVVA